MKRQISSSLLLVTFLCVSMSMYVYYKYYEDGITVLQNQLTVSQNIQSNGLNSAGSEFNTQISDVKAQFQAAICQEADCNFSDTLKNIESPPKRIISSMNFMS